MIGLRIAQVVGLASAALAAANCTVPNPDYVPPGGDPCTMHSQCASRVCLPDNSCSTGLEVAYVDPSGSGTLCKQSSPCFAVEAAIATERPYIKLSETTVGKDAARITDQKLTILAEPGAKLTRDTPGPVMKVDGSSQVEIFDLEISGATGPSGVGIWLPIDTKATLSLQRVTLSNNALAGLHVEKGGAATVAQSTIIGSGDSGVVAQNSTVTISQSTIRSNSAHGILAEKANLTVAQSVIASNGRLGVLSDSSKTAIKQSTIDSNAGGGLSLMMPIAFSIANNFIVQNGTATSGVGGIEIPDLQGDSSDWTLQFNTIADNRRRTDQFDENRSGGVMCFGAFDAPNNVIIRNTGGVASNPQTGGYCTYGNSLVTTPPTPGFVSDTDYHLTLAAPAGILRDSFTCAGQVDIDGDARPQGGKCDLGADEYKAP